jgi:hypothetical protein
MYFIIKDFGFSTAPHSVCSVLRVLLIAPLLAVRQGNLKMHTRGVRCYCIKEL